MCSWGVRSIPGPRFEKSERGLSAADCRSSIWGVTFRQPPGKKRLVFPAAVGGIPGGFQLSPDVLASQSRWRAMGNMVRTEG